MARLLRPVRRLSGAALWGTALGAAGIALLVLYHQRDALWNRELSSLSPVPVPNCATMPCCGATWAPRTCSIWWSSPGPTWNRCCAAPSARPHSEALIDEKVIGGFDSPANYLPSLATQEARRSSLPDCGTLRANLRQGAAGLRTDSEQLTPFLEDVEAARRGRLDRAAGSARHFACRRFRGVDPASIGPLERPAAAARGGPGGARHRFRRASSQRARRSELAAMHELLDLKKESDALYASYLREAIRLSLAGLVAIVALLWIALRSPARVARVLAPLMLAVLAVAAGLAACGRQLTILHLVGMLLIVAVGSNYALFFDAHRPPDADAAGPSQAAPLTLASLVIANLCTVIGFGLLSFSQVPVLEALGATVAPGAFLALLFAAVLTPRPRRRPLAGA